ncbi:MAG: multiheme c-type cytochrome [Chthoniobacterales bacterium]
MRWGTASLSFLTATAACALATPGQQRTANNSGRFVGAVGCKSSSCHGGAGPKRSQYITWTQQDFHSRAYAVLVSSRSARMAETLHAASATTDARCTVCHSPFASVDPARVLPSAHPDEGISCENCHGAASGWVRSHTRSDWNYATRVGAGMHDLRNLYVRANACVACHQNVEPDLLKAGHPELRFELDSQSESEPKHWRDDDPWIGPHSWLTGQAVALREISWALTQRPTDEDEKARWSALTWLLAKTVGVETGAANRSAPVFAANTSDYVEMQRTADEFARAAPQWPFDESVCVQMLRSFAATDAEFTTKANMPVGLLARRGERLVLGIERLAAALQAKGRALNLDTELKSLRDDVRPLDQFDAGRFASHLQALSQALAQRTR